MREGHSYFIYEGNQLTQRTATEYLFCGVTIHCSNIILNMSHRFFISCIFFFGWKVRFCHIVLSFSFFIAFQFFFSFFFKIKWLEKRKSFVTFVGVFCVRRFFFWRNVIMKMWICNQYVFVFKNLGVCNWRGKSPFSICFFDVVQYILFAVPVPSFVPVFLFRRMFALMLGLGLLALARWSNVFRFKTSNNNIERFNIPWPFSIPLLKVVVRER